MPKIREVKTTKWWRDSSASGTNRSVQEEGQSITVLSCPVIDDPQTIFLFGSSRLAA
jgi:hypothetical protein